MSQAVETVTTKPFSDVPIGGLVSVMIPVFNGQRTIPDTLESVRMQTYRPIEVVLVNDGSTDESGRLIEEWAGQSQNSDLKVIVHHRENGGLLRSREDGLRLSRGEYLQFLDADDVLHREKLSTCVPYLADGEFDVVVPRTDKFVDIEDVVGRLTGLPQTRAWTRRELKRASVTRTFWHSVGPLFTRQIVNSVGEFSPDVHPVAEELEFHGRIKLATNRIRYLDDVLNFYRIGNVNSVTGNLTQLYEGRIAGAKTACHLLNSRGVRRWNEWSGVFEMCLRTYYQTVNVSDDEGLKDRAWRGLLEAARAWNPILGGLCRAVPRPLLTGMVRGAYRARMRNPAANGA